jgi:hypothetical protein
MRGLLVVIVALIAANSSAQIAVNYPTLGTGIPTNLIFNGNALTVAGSIYLHPNAGQRRGSVWEAMPLSVLAGFDTTFGFRIPSPSPIFEGEGMCFVLHNAAAGTSALGAWGNQLAYGGSAVNPSPIENSLVVEIDTFLDSANGDTSNNEISVHTNGPLPNGASELLSIGRVTPINPVDDGAVHLMRVLYVPGTLRIFLDNLTTPILTIPYHFNSGGYYVIGGGAAAGLNLIGGTSAYAGFTGATSGAAEVHELISWTWTSSPLPDACFAGTVGQSSGGPYDVLFVNGSSGGLLRTVDVAVAQPFTLSMAQPPSSTVPVPFVLWMLVGVSGYFDITPSPYGTLCIIPHLIAPNLPFLATVCDSIGTGPVALLPATATPWTFSFPSGSPMIADFTLQGLVLQPGGASPIGAITNAVVLRFRLGPPPTLTGVSPPWALPGSTVTLTGTGFSTGAQLTISGATVPIQNPTPTAITFVAPATLPCNATIQIQNPDGQSATRTFNPAPVINTTPFLSGPAAGGATYIITGSGLYPGMSLTFNGNLAVITTTTATSVIAQTPPGVVGPATVLLTAPNGCSATTIYNYL